MFFCLPKVQEGVYDMSLRNKNKVINNSFKILIHNTTGSQHTSFSAAVFSTNLEPCPGLPGQWIVIPARKQFILKIYIF